MGGKGIRRRAKNYREAHGGYSRLPPPPDPSQVDTLPSKLRKILSYSTPSESQGSLKLAKDAGKKKKRDGVGAAHPENAKDEVELEETNMEDGDDAENFAPQHSDEKKKKKRKRKPVLDLRFKEELEKSRGRLKRKERKKKYLEAKKNKKGKKGESVDDFPGREKIRFGEVVQAPPKLVAPKALKNVQDASKERVRVKAIEAYRQLKKWNSRPGIQLPPPVTASL